MMACFFSKLDHSFHLDKGCIALCMENMQRSTDLTSLEIVEMFVTVFCFLKDSASNSQTLLEDFRTCQGYVFLTEFLLKSDKRNLNLRNELIIKTIHFFIYQVRSMFESRYDGRCPKFGATCGFALVLWTHRTSFESDCRQCLFVRIGVISNARARQ